MSFRWFDTISDLQSGREQIRQRRYGVIVCRQGRFEAIQFRPWPKIISVAEVRFWGSRRQERAAADECLLYYNQPLQHSNYLTLAYIHTNWATPYRTFNAALRVLDQVAEIKRSDAILCDVTNPRITDRLLRRQGWIRHLEQSPRRQWIKRFYGEYGGRVRNAECGVNSVPLSERVGASRR